MIIGLSRCTCDHNFARWAGSFRPLPIRRLNANPGVRLNVWTNVQSVALESTCETDLSCWIWYRMSFTNSRFRRWIQQFGLAQSALSKKGSRQRSCDWQSRHGIPRFDPLASIPISHAGTRNICLCVRTSSNPLFAWCFQLHSVHNSFFNSRFWFPRSSSDALNSTPSPECSSGTLRMLLDKTIPCRLPTTVV